MPDAIFAFDRQTARSRDADGRMRVKNCVLSVAEVNPYYGREIPGSKELGLDPEKVYELYRDPAEMEKAAKTFDGLPLMIKHVAQTADEPRKEYIGGSVHNVAFDGKNLRGDLLVWDGSAIELIESDELSDLSCSYRYVPVMREGMAGGKKHDGVMTQLEGNHVAMVDDGRASGAHVADAALAAPKTSDPSTQGAKAMPLEQQPGAAAPQAPAAAPAPGSPAGEMNEQNNMAMIGQALKQIGIVLQDIHAAVKGGVNAPAPAPAAAPAPEAAAPQGEPGAEDNDPDGIEKKPEGAADFSLESPLKEEGTLQANDEELIGPESGEKVDVPNAENDGTPARGNEPAEPVTGAMDAKSVKVMIDKAVKADRAARAALDAAKSEVRHILGDVHAMDSASDVYRAALVQSGIADTDIPKGGEKVAWQSFRNAAAVARGAMPAGVVTHAMDSAAKTDTATRLSGLVGKISVKG